MVEGAALEKRWVARPREFESLPLRHFLLLQEMTGLLAFLKVNY